MTRGGRPRAEAPSAAAGGALTVAVTLAAYSAAQFLAFRRVPTGLVNDAAEEALRGVRLLAEGRLEVITSVLGNSAETGHLYLLGLAARLLGPTWAAISAPTMVLAVACVVLVTLSVRRLAPAAPPWVGGTVAAASPWLFHYGQVGLRAMWAPAFAAATVLLLERADRDDRARWWLAAGATIGLSLYAYTSCRVLPLAVAAVAGIAWWRRRDDRRRLARGCGLAALAALAVSLPNLAFFAGHPAEYLLRGAYVFPDDRSLIARNLLWTVLLPLHVPAEFSAISGPGHYFDGAACGLLTGVRPVDVLTAVAIARGVVLAVRRRAETLPALLLAVLVTADAVLGVAGPSPTRLTVVLPTYLALAGLAVAELAGRRRGVAAIVLVAMVAINAYGYAFTFRRSQEAQRFFAPAVTALAERAGALTVAGQRVLCVVSESANTVRYFTAGHPERAAVAEFYLRPPEAAEIPVAAFAPDVVLIDGVQRFDVIRARLAALGTVEEQAEFTEVRLAPR